MIELLSPHVFLRKFSEHLNACYLNIPMLESSVQQSILEYLTSRRAFSLLFFFFYTYLCSSSHFAH